MKLIFVTSIVFLTGAFASCTSPKVPNECKMFNCSLAEPSRVSCMSKCTYGNKEQICNVTSFSFEGCRKTTKVVPARVTNILSVPEFICDAYLSVIRHIVVDSLVRRGTIRENAALDEILQSRCCRCAGYIGIVGRNLLSFPLSFLNYIPVLNGGVISLR